MRNDFKSYEEVAVAAGLEGLVKETYIKYMKTRWAEDEVVKSRCGYAMEWAERFRNKEAWNSSDLEGQRILVKLGWVSKSI